MGSIQGLRSEAVGLRSLEDTNLQISQHLGGVNKSLGSQISGIIDQLQGVITERTKAYNASMVSLSKNINGKEGIGSKSMGVVFGLVGFVFDIVGAPSKTATYVKAAFDALKIISDTIGVRYNINSAVYDYEKGSSQIGYTYIQNKDGSTDKSLPDNASIFIDSGAATLLNIRNSLMPSYRSFNVRTLENGAEQTYIGSLRKR